MRKLCILVVTIFLVGMNCSKVFSFSLYRICQSNDSITLNFNPLKDTCQNFVSYQVFWKKNPNQNFQVIDTLQDAGLSRYIHVPDNLNNLEDWRYIIKATVDCNPNRVSFTDTLRVDKQRPDAIELDSISVAGPNAIRLGWDPHPDPAIMGYTIFYVEGGQTRRLDRVFGHKKTSYIEDSLSQPNVQKEKFRIGAFDSCRNESAVSTNVHRSILLDEPSVDTCKGTIGLKWSAYQGWDVGSYAIIAETDSGKRQIAKTVDGNETATNVNELPGGTTYNVFVQARKKGTSGKISSRSNVKKVTLGGSAKLGSAYVKSATVVDSQVRINFFVENPTALNSVKILKGPNPSKLSVFRRISPGSKKDFTILDGKTDPQSSAIYYQVIADGLCADKSIESNTVKTVNLTEKTIGDSIRFRWNEFEGFSGGIQSYVIQKQTRTGVAESWNNVETLNGDQLAFRKLNEFKESDENRACFRVKALEGSGNEFGFQETSFSNVVCLLSDPKVFVPDAIVVGGVNQVFKPKGSFIDKKRSKMIIYNRWGEEVFQTDNLNEGWDARYNGDIVSQGIYFYRLTIVGLNKEITTRQGTFKVIR